MTEKLGPRKTHGLHGTQGPGKSGLKTHGTLLIPIIRTSVVLTSTWVLTRWQRHLRLTNGGISIDLHKERLKSRPRCQASAAMESGHKCRAASRAISTIRHCQSCRGEVGVGYTHADSSLGRGPAAAWLGWRHGLGMAVLQRRAGVLVLGYRAGPRQTECQGEYYSL